MLALLLFFAGRVSVLWQQYEKPEPLKRVEEINRPVPLIQIDEIKDGKLVGIVNDPRIRIRSGKNIAFLDEEKKFEIDITHLGISGSAEEKGKVPEGAKFVASKKGKYFYVLDSASAKRLSPKNLLFFTTKEEAVKAGYKERGR